MQAPEEIKEKKKYGRLTALEIISQGVYYVPETNRKMGEHISMLFKKPDEDKIKPSIVEETVACFKEGFNCAQAVLSAYGPEFGLDREEALKLGGAFGSGMGMGETCGAVTGALMVIGLKHTRAKGSGLFTRERTADAAHEFVAQFKARNGSAVCKELLGCDVSTPEGLKVSKKGKYFKKRCPKFVQDAAEILDELLKG